MKFVITLLTLSLSVQVYAETVTAKDNLATVVEAATSVGAGAGLMIGINRANQISNDNYARDAAVTPPSPRTSFAPCGANTDSQTTPACPPEGSPAQATTNSNPLVVVSELKDCSCYGAQKPNGTSNDNDEVKRIRRVCSCYFGQKDKSTGAATFLEQTLAAIKRQTAEQITDSGPRINRTLGFFYQGPQIQASLLEGNNSSELQGFYQPVKFDLDIIRNIGKLNQSLGEKRLDRINKIASRLQAPQSREYADNIARYRSEAEISSADLKGVMPDPHFAAPIIQGSSAVSDAKSCVPIRHFMTMKQVDFSNDLYKSISSLDPSSPEEIKKWDLNELKKQFIYNYNNNSVSYQEKELVQEKIKFLIANPLYSNLLASRSATSPELKAQFLSRMKENYAPSGCAQPSAQCAVANFDKIRKSDREFFKDEKVKTIIQENLQSDADALLHDPALLVGNGDYHVPSTSSIKLPGEDNRFNITQLSIGTDINSAAFFKDATEQCAKIAPYLQSRNPLEFRGQNIAGKAAYTQFENSVRANLDPNPETNDEYKKFQANMCDKTHCKDKREKNSGFLTCEDGKTFAEYMQNKNCSGSDWACWSQRLGNYLKDYPVAKADGELDYLTEDKQALLFSRYLSHGKSQVAEGITNPSAASAVLAESKVARSGSGIRFVRDGNEGSSSEIIATSRQLDAQINRTIASNSSAQIPSAEAAAGAPQATSSTAPVADPVHAASVSGPVMASPVALLPNTVSGPDLSNEIAQARTESNDLQAQASSLVSRRNTAESDAEKAAFDQRIAELNRRADASNAKADELEKQLKARGTITPATAVAATSNAATASKTTTTTSSPSFSSAAPSNFASSNAFQSFGSGGNSFSISSTPSAGTASLGRSTASSGGINLNFKYGNDAKVGDVGSSGAGIIVAGDSSSFPANATLAESVNNSPEVNIGSVSTDVAIKLSAKDIPTISQFAEVIRAQPGSIIRLVYSVPGESSREIVVAKNSNGSLFFPAVRGLTGARLALLNSTLDTSTK